MCKRNACVHCVPCETLIQTPEQEVAQTTKPHTFFEPSRPPLPTKPQPAWFYFTTETPTPYAWVPLIHTPPADRVPHETPRPVCEPGTITALITGAIILATYLIVHGKK